MLVSRFYPKVGYQSISLNQKDTEPCLWRSSYLAVNPRKMAEASLEFVTNCQIDYNTIAANAFDYAADELHVIRS